LTFDVNYGIIQLYANRGGKEMAIIKGKAMWAMVHTPDTKFEPMYRIDLLVDKKTADEVKEIGLKVKETKDGLLVRFRRKVNRKDGTVNKPPIVVDAAKQPFGENIGNGSVVKVQFRPYKYDFRGNKGVSADLVAIQVLDLIPFGKSEVEFDVEEGFVSKTETKKKVIESGDDIVEF
jgi:hypothetical protein